MSRPFATTDLCDAHKDDASGRFRVLALPWRHWGARPYFSGVVRTVRCLEDNTQVKQVLEQQPGHGQVLVVDGAGQMARALMGGLIAASAARQGWAGVVVHGAVRDVHELAQCDLGICALGVVPMPTQRAGQGLVDVPLTLAGVWVRPGDWLYADEDGIVVSDRPLSR